MKIAPLPGGTRRRANFTPMIDVVFLLLVFFMMISRFGGPEGMPLALSGGGEGWQGPPRLVTVGADGVALNGQPLAPEALAAALTPLMQAPTDPVVVQAAPGVPLQRLVSVMESLRGEGLLTLVLVP